MPANKITETPAEKRARLREELEAAERGEERKPAHGVHVGPDPWGVAPKGAEVDMDIREPERNPHRSPHTPAVGHPGTL